MIFMAMVFMAMTLSLPPSLPGFRLQFFDRCAREDEHGMERDQSELLGQFPAFPLFVEAILEPHDDARPLEPWCRSTLFSRGSLTFLRFNLCSRRHESLLSACWIEVCFRANDLQAE